ncbi:Uncharacterized conserved protein, DUF885 familyt [Catalinimonas alkaloidigena]|uniref:Uncharacterized conserved protein, DUF885 familyt n=1 Tax=Catalinimonas alkaloidigena TaxID=1075417 RepID=A0A1G9A3B0_9BACT|nr:DUF885 domain-containing protein [Catalinimonas alkaloidigena]SDK21833.1 Uncharacterized conserved protein, DUF885 familyt [Catalinimonas alkaloidigena]
MASLLLSGCSEPSASSDQAQTQTEPSIDSLFAQYYEERLHLYPLEATQAGDARYNDQLPNSIAQAFRTEEQQFFTRYREQLQRYDRAQLDPEQQISYDILKWECDIALESLHYPTHLTPINQFYSLQLTIGQWAGGTGAQPFETPEDYENWLRRLEAFAVWADTAIANMRQGIAQAYVLPRALTEKVIPQMAALAQGPVEHHLFYTPVTRLPDRLSAEEQQRLTQDYKDAVQHMVIPTFQKLHAFFRDEYLPASRNTAGISALEGGKAYYAHQIKTYTTTDMTADEVFALGQREVERLSAEMETVKQQVGFEGDLKAFFDHVRTRQELMPYREPQQVIDHFNDIYERMQPNLRTLFDLVPKTPFEVRRTEAFREQSASAEYNQGSLDGTRPGIFYVPIPDVQHYNVFADEDLFLHEAIPGHHYQISLQQENDRLPDFRKTLWYSAYGEGWALYCESLGKELGLYEDPYQYFGMLSAEMHRAIRLVVDAGIHAKGWTREEAIQYSLDHEAEPEESIVAEVERYMSWPGQALSYKVGQLKIRELRARAEETLGDQFDIREFHNQVLESGCLPLAVLEAKVDRWLDKKKGA